ncbi:MAG: hypothetical protein LBH75_04635 [Treponema sp.]|nr:hypothetical protein [Treponema sp.]
MFQPETAYDYRKFKIIFDIFEIIIDVRYGNFLHLPFEGGAAEQPAKTMEALSLIRALFRQYIASRQRDEMEKIKRQNPPHRFRR